MNKSKIKLSVLVLQWYEYGFKPDTPDEVVKEVIEMVNNKATSQELFDIYGDYLTVEDNNGDIPEDFITQEQVNGGQTVEVWEYGKHMHFLGSNRTAKNISYYDTDTY